MKKAFLLFTFLALATLTMAQEKPSWQRQLEELISMEDIDGESLEQSYELLADLAENKININTATREQLEQFPFLSAEQVEDICEYIYRYAPLQSIHELAMVESLDAPRRRLLECFVEVGPMPSEKRSVSLKNMLHYGKNEASAWMRIPLYERKGDESGYLGYKYKHWLRYNFNYGQTMKFGLIASQDAGETFFSGRKNMGYDYYSFYFMLRNIGRMKALAVGRYRLRFGQGLAMNTSYTWGKLAWLSTLGRNETDIKAHSSRSEANYLQGAAATVELTKGLELTGFLSWRKIDATLNSDSSTIRTILTSGYHRTESEVDRKNNASQFAGGGHLGFRRLPFNVGITAFYTSFSRELQPDTRQRFRRYYPSGKGFWNLSADYSYVSPRLTFAGETATGDSHAVATLNTLSFRATNELSLVALQRFYSYRYYSVFGRSFGENSRVSDESGVLLGARWQDGVWDLMAYSDYSHAAWPRYGVDDASSTWDNLAQVIYTRNRWQLSARYRIKSRDRDNSDKSGLTKETVQRARLALRYAADNWSLRTQGDFAHSKYLSTSTGFMVSEHFNITWRWLRLHAAVAYFNTDDYASRLYMYEHQLRYSYYFPVYYGEGIHYMFDIEASPCRNLVLAAKIGTTDYFDRDHIGSGLQQIDASAMTDIEVQVRLKF